MKVKEEREKVGLKLNIQKTKIMASGASTSWHVDRETVVDFILLGSKITAEGDCSLCFIHPRFLIMYSAYKLNKQGDSIQP